MRQGRWCRWCMAVGILLFLWGASSAMAQTPQSELVPSYATWAQVLLGLLIAMIGAYAKGLEGRVRKVEDTASAMQRSLDRDYNTKAELAAQFSEVKASLSAVHRRLDYLRVPVVPARLHADDGV